MAELKFSRHSLNRSIVIVFVASLFASVAIGALGGCRKPVETKAVGNQTSESQKPTLAIPQASWEPFFFKEINKHTSEAKLPSLRTVVLPGTDVEARIWFVAGHRGLDGIILRRASDQWSAMYLNGLSGKTGTPDYYKQLGPPRSSWETVWQDLVAAGILDLPDASRVDCNVLGLDGIDYVVETNANNAYRTFLYDNPAVAPCNEAKRMLKLIQIVNHEFGLEWPTAK